MTEPDLDELRAELDGYAAPQKTAARTPREERIIAGFEDIQRFVDEQGRAPQRGEGRDIFERIYAVRLDRIRALEECRALVAELDRQGLLDGAADEAEFETIDDETLMAELSETPSEADDITTLRHVRSQNGKRLTDEIANREPCLDFDRFKPLFEHIQNELDAGLRETRTFEKDASIRKGEFFVLGGLKIHIAEMGDVISEYERENRRVRVIFENGTENNYLLRSLQRALYKKENLGRRITDHAAGPLFADAPENGDTQSGTIYVLRSNSDLPQIAEQRDVLHKIGVTGGKVETRISNAALDPTFLMADVEIVATYELYNINRVKLENLIHKFFGAARYDIEITDRMGNPIKPREWFLVPLDVIDKTVDLIRDGAIGDCEYDPSTASLKAT